MLCVLMKILSHANAEKKTESLKVSNFALLMIVFKWHYGTEGVKFTASAYLSGLLHVYSSSRQFRFSSDKNSTHSTR